MPYNLIRIGIWVAIFFISTSSAALLRYRLGLNTFPVHVQTNPTLNGEVLAVRMTSINGSTQQLIRVVDGENIVWSTLTNRSPLEDIELETTQPISAGSITVRFGLSWDSAWFESKPSLNESVKLQDNPNSRYIAKVHWSNLTRTWLPGVKVGRNWQGDAWLFIPSICNGFLFTALAYIATRCLSGPPTTFKDKKHYLITNALVFTIGTGALLVLTIYLVLLAKRLVDSVDGRAFFIAFLGFSLVISAPLGLYALKPYLQTWRTNPNFRLSIVSTLWILVFAIKLTIVANLNINQTGDFLDYQNLGQRFANNTVLEHWDYNYPLLPVIAKRSYVFSYPAVVLFGKESIGYVNCILQAVTALLIAWIVKSTSGAKYSALAAFIFLLWPDFLFSNSITTHDIPGYLWLILGVTAACKQQSILQATPPLVVGTWKRTFASIATALVFGVSLALLEWTRGFLPFVLSSILLFTYLKFSERSKDENLPRLPWITWCISSVVIFFITSQLIQSSFTKAVGNVQTTSLLDYIASDSTRSTSIWYEMHPFRFNYLPSVPDDIATNLKLRKLVHEKCTLASELPNHILSKIGILARPDDYLQLIKLGFESKNNRTFPVYLQTTLYNFACLLSVFFSAVLIIRISITPQKPLTNEEWILYGAGLFQLTIVLLLTETAGTYDAVLGVLGPVAFVMIYSSCEQNNLTTSTLPAISIGLKRMAVGASMLLMLWTLLIMAGVLLRDSHLSFIDFRRQNIEINGDIQDFHVEESEDRITIRFVGHEKTDYNSKAIGECTVTIHGLNRGKIQGFASGNQYQDGVPSKNRFPKDIGKCTIRTNDHILFESDLSDLNKPKWIKFDTSEDDTLTIKLIVNYSSLQRMQQGNTEIPVVALEYLSTFH